MSSYLFTEITVNCVVLWYNSKVKIVKKTVQEKLSFK